MANKESLSLKIQTKLKAKSLGSDQPVFITWCDAIAEAIVEEYSQSNTKVKITVDGNDLEGYID
ncbi:MAG: hypothetical protein GY714_12150 [Desulfobacterales bacterium]|nr:hypothetical protein [Desulfobacterales bacterium]